ncbi:MAG: type IV toxin-antitoxin system AbiEi family antitoxin domain-containing protein [Zoogloeaceae bacterium]|jgi:predicted transcriptional regulator of viral defense system|nr:type IV toxin-antitoxin system AbiEi family antitoxin domain-containing protein [Zoogloeaceae bacterium]
MEYTSPTPLPEGRQRLTALVGGTGDVIRVDDAVRLLNLDRISAAKMLARWTSQGWLRRVSRGAYVPASLNTLGSAHVLDDPWVLVPNLFSPAYVGGRTAAEYWDLTEQLFNDIVVITSQAVRQKTQCRHGTTFTVKRIAPEKIFGTKTVWRGRSKVLVSDLERTIVDLLDDPALGGGIQHVADCLAEYLKRKDRNDTRLLAYIEQLGNGAVFKRLGFLAETDDKAVRLVQECRKRLTKGNVKIDPALECPRIVSRWRICIPEHWAQRNQT